MCTTVARFVLACHWTALLSIIYPGHTPELTSPLPLQHHMKIGIIYCNEHNQVSKKIHTFHGNQLMIYILTFLFRVGKSESRYSTTSWWPSVTARSLQVRRRKFFSYTLAPNSGTRNLTMFKCPLLAAKWRAVSLNWKWIERNKKYYLKHNI